MPDQGILAKQCAGKRAFPLPRLLPVNDTLIDYLAFDFNYDFPSFQLAVQRGLENYNTGKFPKAAEYLGIAYEIVRRIDQVYLPMTQGVLLLRSIANSGCGKTVEALHDIEVGLQVLPYCVPSMFWRGFLLLKSGDRIEAAYKTLQDIIRINPEWRNLVELTIALFLHVHGFHDKAILMCSRVIKRLEKEHGSLDHEFDRLSKENDEKRAAGSKEKKQVSVARSEQVGGSSSSTAGKDGKTKIDKKTASQGETTSTAPSNKASTAYDPYRSYETREAKRDRQRVNLLRVLAFYIRGESYKFHEHGVYFVTQASDDFSVVLDMAGSTFKSWLGKGLTSSPTRVDEIFRECKLLHPHFPKADARDYTFYSMLTRGQRPFSVYGRVVQFCVKTRRFAAAKKKALIASASNPSSPTKVVKRVTAKDEREAKKADLARRRADMARKLGQQNFNDGSDPVMWAPTDYRMSHVTPYLRGWVQPGIAARSSSLGGNRSMSPSMSRSPSNALGGTSMSKVTTAGGSSVAGGYNSSLAGGGVSDAEARTPRKGHYKHTDGEDTVIPTPWEIKSGAHRDRLQKSKSSRSPSTRRQSKTGASKDSAATGVSSANNRRTSMSRSRSASRRTPSAPSSKATLATSARGARSRSPAAGSRSKASTVASDGKPRVVNGRLLAPPVTGRNPEIRVPNMPTAKHGISLNVIGADDNFTGESETSAMSKSNFLYKSGLKVGWSDTLLSVAKSGKEIMESNAISKAVTDLLGLQVGSTQGDDIGSTTPSSPAAYNNQVAEQVAQPLSAGNVVYDAVESKSQSAAPQLGLPETSPTPGGVGASTLDSSTVALGDVVSTVTLRAAAQFAQMAAEADEAVPPSAVAPPGEDVSRPVAAPSEKIDAVRGSGAPEQPTSGNDAAPPQAPTGSVKKYDPSPGEAPVAAVPSSTPGDAPEKSYSSSAAPPSRSISMASASAAKAKPKRPKRTSTQSQYVGADPTVLEAFGLKNIDVGGGETDDLLKLHETPLNTAPQPYAVEAALSRPLKEAKIPPSTKYEDWCHEAMIRAEYYYRKELAERGEGSPTADETGGGIGGERATLRDKYKRDDICSHLRNIAVYRAKDGTKKDVIDVIYDGGFEDVCFADCGIDAIQEVTDMAVVDPRDYTKHFVAI
ncbi:unnamed protein product [Amoebophrya sp. A25]|nr:unnamed protein product [Amoebophrya sp. A25]|eukprot:GSA25T00006186001.1